MKVIISQMVLIEGEDFPSNWEKGYDSEIIPRVGASIEDPIWKDPGEYQVKNVTINYSSNECYVYMGRYANIIPNERKEEFGKIAELHGWKANWMR